MAVFFPNKTDQTDEFTSEMAGYGLKYYSASDNTCALSLLGPQCRFGDKILTF